jgi:hypothetical protein
VVSGQLGAARLLAEYYRSLKIHAKLPSGSLLVPLLTTDHEPPTTELALDARQDDAPDQVALRREEEEQHRE